MPHSFTISKDVVHLFGHTLVYLIIKCTYCLLVSFIIWELENKESILNVTIRFQVTKALKSIPFRPQFKPKSMQVHIWQPIFFDNLHCKKSVRFLFRTLQRFIMETFFECTVETGMICRRVQYSVQLVFCFQNCSDLLWETRKIWNLSILIAS